MTATMDFFGHQQAAQASSRRLVLLFLLAVAGIVLLVYFAFAIAFQASGSSGSLWDPALLIAVTAVTVTVIGLASAFKMAQLAGGGAKVAELLGGREVPAETSDPQERMLRNVVEEMSIASGVPVPSVYVLDDEEGLNAFAAGTTPQNAAVAVTRGLLQQLDRDELQGVIAHEFSHVFHGDMRLNIRLMGWLFGILVLAVVGRTIVHSVGRVRFSNTRGKGGGAIAGIVVFGFCLMLIGGLGVFFGRLIQAAVSRQREFLADASAVQYTRNPRGIGVALARIGGLTGRITNPHAAEASHLFFADGISHFFGNLMASHPPIEQRVERVLPGFLREVAGGRPMLQAAVAVAPPPDAAGIAGLAGSPLEAQPAASPESVVRSVGTVLPGHVAAAKQMLQQLPLEVLAAAREPARAPALCCALLLERDASARAAQLQQLQSMDVSLAHEAGSLAMQLIDVDRGARLPLLELTVPALRRLSPATSRNLRQTAHALATADQQMSTFELALLSLLDRYLPGALQRRVVGRPIGITQLSSEITAVLSSLAHAGSGGDAEAAARAFAAGVASIDGLGPLALQPEEGGMRQQLSAALPRCEQLSPLGKRQLLLASARTVGADGQVRAEESELLRALAEILACPMPPVFAPDGSIVA